MSTDTVTADREPVCDCYPGGVNPADYEGPQPWCDVHGQPSVAYRVGIQEGQRRLFSEAAIRHDHGERIAAAIEAKRDAIQATAEGVFDDHVRDLADREVQGMDTAAQIVKELR